ncbi:MAG: ribose transport system permease protein [Rhodothermales bacterium]|jgi:ribose transport system permease protein
MQTFIRDYGMIFVLLLLGALFSILTFKEQHPSGADAGTQVAEQILANSAASAVVVVGRDTEDDREFTAAAESALSAGGGSVIAVVNGAPADVRRALEAASDQKVSAIATNNVTAKWTVYDAVEGVNSEMCVTPTPYKWPDFLKMSNLLGVANQTAIYAIIAIGMTMVIITAGIDLCVGSLVALAAVVSAMVIRGMGGSDASLMAVLLGCLAGMMVCGLAGLFNGLMVTTFRIPPFIVTLGMMMMASGLAFRLSEGRSIPELPRAFFWLGGGTTVGIPNPVWLMLLLYVIAHIVMTRMTFGRFVYAIGGNEEAARLSGVPVSAVLLAVYTVCGALAGLGGIVLASQLAAGDPKFGVMYELDVIAAVVVGGTSLMGGSGKIVGTLIGAFIIAVIKNGMNLTNVDPFNQRIVLGAVLLAAVLIDTLKRRRAT